MLITLGLIECRSLSNDKPLFREVTFLPNLDTVLLERIKIGPYAWKDVLSSNTVETLPTNEVVMCIECHLERQLAAERLASFATFLEPEVT